LAGPGSKVQRRRRHPEQAARIDGRSFGTRALVVVPVLSRSAGAGQPQNDGPKNGGKVRPRAIVHSPQDRMAEAVGLARAIDLDVRGQLLVTLANPRPATLLGKGKVEEIKSCVEENEIGLVVVDHALTPVQQRNLETEIDTKVLDRTGLILEIFGHRAATREGRLQVELAHLSYQKSRLVRSWTHLERQRGGAGFLGGPGESQLELDRRLIQDRIDSLKGELAKVVRTRELNRAGRARVPYPVVAIVGYTNAGKSTLFNRLTGAGVRAEDQVFATLDPTMREIRLPAGRKIILSDTVGFISDLPTALVAAFRATLEEVVHADLILHVRDISHAETEAQANDVACVLYDLGIDTGAAEAPVLQIWNKIDSLDDEPLRALEHEAQRNEHQPVLISAATGAGIDALRAAIEMRITKRDEELQVVVPPTAGALIHWLHENTSVLAQDVREDGGTNARIRVSAERRGRLDAQLRKAGARLMDTP
jgi:GTPase